MTRVLVSTGLRVLVAVAVGVAAAAGLAALRGGEFSHEIRISLWIVGCLMLGMAVASLSSSTRHAQGELSNVFIGRRLLGDDERGGAGATVVLAISGFCMVRHCAARQLTRCRECVRSPAPGFENDA